jgi:hypothetical protein
VNWENKKNNITGRTSREKSIIDVLIFGNGHVLHHPPTKRAVGWSVKINDNGLKRADL